MPEPNRRRRRKYKAGRDIARVEDQNPDGTLVPAITEEVAAKAKQKSVEASR